MTLMIDRIADLAGTLEADPELAARVVGSRMEVFDITNVAKYVESDDRFDAFDHPCGPPFPLYWMECPHPLADTDMVLAALDGEQCGMLCAADTDRDGLAVVSVSLYLMRGKKVVGPVTSWEVEFPVDGAPWVRVRRPVAGWFLDEITRLGESHSRNKSDRYWWRKEHPEWEDLNATDLAAAIQSERANLAREMERLVAERDAASERLREVHAMGATITVGLCLNRVLAAHAFLACKNVSTETVVPPRKMSQKHARRHGKPLVRYKVLKIAAMGRPRSGSSGSGDAEDRSLHIVRGHFKTFTDDKPLFGSRTGTYWWSQALRGNKDVGVVVKDYELVGP